MRKRLHWFIPLVLPIAFLCFGFGGGDNTDYPSGSPGGYTGSPGDGHNCVACHNGSASSVTGWITSNIPAEGYTPGTTYTITATATGSGKKGFEISPQNPSGGLLGTLTPGSGNKLCNGNKAITHSSSVSGSSATWTFSWTAPASGTGSVTFYGAFTVTKPVTKLCTMVVNESASQPLTANATATPSTINAGQTSQLNVTASGGTGSYSYSWVSNPAGFTSTLQNPVVSPTATTTYTVTVTSGTSTVNSSATVIVNAAVPLTATATAIPSTICAGQSSNLGVNVSGGNPPYSFSWSSNPAGFTSTLQDPVVSPTTTTTYTVTVGDGSSNVNSSVTVNVTPAPNVSSGSDTTICHDAISVPLHGTASGYTSVAWTTSGDGTFSTTSALNSIYTLGPNDHNATSLSLTLTATPVSPCVNPVASVRHFELVVCEGVAGNTGNGSVFTLSPNPSNGVVHLDCSGTNNQLVNVTVFSSEGKQVLAKTMEGTKGTLDLSDFTKGLYYIKVQTTDACKIQKLLLQ